jgi:hypothetical protein
MQIKITLRFHLTLLERLPSRTPPTTNVGEDVGKKETSYNVVCKLVEPLWKTV